MNKSILTLLIFTFAACGQASQNNNTVSNEEFSGYPPNSDILEYTDTPGLSTVTVMFADNIEMQGEYFNGKRNGTWTEYHPNGVVKTITTFVNGQQHGIEIEMDDRGKLTQKSFYHNGIYEGEFMYYKNGKVTEKRNYTNGELDGTFSKYYTNGKIMEESNYQNNKIHGTAKWYDQDGNVTIQYEYSNGELVQNDEE